MKKNINSKHIGRVFVYTLLSLFLCMAGAGKVSAKGLEPVVLLGNTYYSRSGIETSLQLWIFNGKLETLNPKLYNSRFTGDVYLYIDDKKVANLKEMWSNISDAHLTYFKDISGDVGYSSSIILNGKTVGSAQLQNLKCGQVGAFSNPYESEKSWVTVDLNLSFNKTFSYYGHKFTVKGKWQDQSSGSLVQKDVALDRSTSGNVRPINFKVQPSGDKMMFIWEQQGYEGYSSTLGKWLVYKRVAGKNVKLGEVAANVHSLLIEKKKYSCTHDYIITFVPQECEGEETVSGLTANLPATSHKLNDDICQVCGNSFFRYQTTDGNKVDISNKNFGATVVEHYRVGEDNKCVIELDAPITQIPAQAFYDSNITGNLVIPNTVTTIDNEAFFGCEYLNGTLTLSNSLTSIGNKAFIACSGLTGELTIPNSVKTIGKWAFCNCSGFTGKLTLSNSVTTIEENAFYNCSRLTGDLTIPSSVKNIGSSAFWNCSGFKGDLTIPNSVTTIGGVAFSGCSGLTGDLTIPSSVTTIGNAAFYNCSGLTGDLLLPKSLEVIGTSAFGNCNNIKTITFQSLPKVIGAYFYLQAKKVSLSDDSYISDKANGTVDAISYTRTMTNNWGTLVLPYSLTLTGSEPYCLYKIETLTGDELVLSRLEGVVAAGTPCIVKRNGTGSELTFDANDATLNVAIEAQTVDDMTFSGTYWTEDVNSGYVISKDRFWNVAELNSSASVKGVKVQPFRAWLSGTSANAPARLSMRIDGSATGINAAEALDALNDAEAEYYNLSGKRLNAPQKGVNIVRMKSGKTKKIIIK